VSGRPDIQVTVSESCQRGGSGECVQAHLPCLPLGAPVHYEQTVGPCRPSGAPVHYEQTVRSPCQSHAREEEAASVCRHTGLAAPWVHRYTMSKQSGLPPLGCTGTLRANSQVTVSESCQRGGSRECVQAHLPCRPLGAPVHYEQTVRPAAPRVHRYTTSKQSGHRVRVMPGRSKPRVCAGTLALPPLGCTGTL